MGGYTFIGGVGQPGFGCDLQVVGGVGAASYVIQVDNSSSFTAPLTLNRTVTAVCPHRLPASDSGTGQIGADSAHITPDPRAHPPAPRGTRRSCASTIYPGPGIVCAPQQ